MGYLIVLGWRFSRSFNEGNSFLLASATELCGHLMGRNERAKTVADPGKKVTKANQGDVWSSMVLTSGEGHDQLNNVKDAQWAINGRV